MQIFIDSAQISEIKDCAQMGIIDGVTTNPSLIKASGKKLENVIREITEIVDGPISAEVIATDTAEMIKEGKALAAIHPNIVVKIPLIAEGLRAVSALARENIRTNVTLCFSAPQALMAAKAGATYISPFIGRLDDIAHFGMDLIEQIVRIYDNYGFSTEVLAASIRSPLHVVEAAQVGAHVSTIPYKVILQLLKHPLTDLGLEKFLADASA